MQQSGKLLFGSVVNGKWIDVCVGNAFMRSKRLCNLSGSLDDSTIDLVSMHFSILTYRSKSLPGGMHECIPYEHPNKQQFKCDVLPKIFIQRYIVHYGIRFVN